MKNILSTLFNFNEIKLRHDDDFADRLSRSYTSGILFVFCLIITSTHYVGNVIECWCPAHFTDSHKSYANSICWVSNTYYVPMQNQIPVDESLNYINYYQWVPFILMFQGILCYVPRLIWKFFSKKSGINVSQIIEAAMVGGKTYYIDVRENTYKYVAFQMHRYLHTIRVRPSNKLGLSDKIVAKCCYQCYSGIRGSYLTAVYISSKILYLANAIGQLFILNMFLGQEFHLFGVEFLYRLYLGRKWFSSLRFPRVTLCNFELRHQTQLHKYILQCALPLNIFNEKLFIIIWFWYVILSLVTFHSLIWWCYNLLRWRNNYNFVKSKLIYKYPEVSKRQKAKLINFTNHYLQKDGLFILHLLAQTTGTIAAADIICKLWENQNKRNSNESKVYGTGNLLEALTGRTPFRNNTSLLKEEV